MTKDRNSILYNFPVQFPCGPKHCRLNGAIFAFSWVVLSVVSGLTAIYFWG